MKRQYRDNRVIFSLAVYVKALADRGELNEEDFFESVYSNAAEHGHEKFRIGDDWKEELPHIINKFGWRIFEAGKSGLSGGNAGNG
jgi:hypothetical protein